MHKLVTFGLALAAVAAAPLAADRALAGETGATYRVTFEGTWAAKTHPMEYPRGAHYSGVIGTTHGADYALFKAGAKATMGLKNLSEKGQHSPFDAEIRAAIGAGKAGVLIETGPIFNPPGKVTATFKTDAQFPMVSLAAMIAPSPDWFAGAASVNLIENNQWVETKTVTVYAWDAGTDDGTTYTAPDKESQPHRAVQLNDAPHFMKGGKRISVGTFTFTRVNPPASN